MFVDDVLDRFPEGSFIYNRITELRRGSPEDVVFKLNLDGSVHMELSDLLKGETFSGLTPVTTEMSVTLRGTSGLEVVAYGNDRKTVSPLAPTEWAWRVEPLDYADTELLTLSVFAHVEEGRAVTLQTFEDEVEVKVSRWRLVQDLASAINPYWAFTVAALPVMWSGFVFFRDEKWKKAKPDHEPYSPPSSPKKDKKKPRR
ncbi:MAG: hypothetical protein RDA78_25695 [Roseibium sp.]|uniref:hypothetical protein n=1 Tax=Roseibium sp. TaxID=1936156 RepID=UPI003D9C3840